MPTETTMKEGIIRWMPVSRPPEIFMQIILLITTDDGKVDIFFQRRESEYEPLALFAKFTPDVIAWAYLPDPYKP